MPSLTPSVGPSTLPSWVPSTYPIGLQTTTRLTLPTSSPSRWSHRDLPVATSSPNGAASLFIELNLSFAQVTVMVLSSLSDTLVSILQRAYPTLTKKDIIVELYDQDRRRKARTVVKITIEPSERLNFQTAADVADAIVGIIEQRTKAEVLPHVTHGQRVPLGQWTGWINSDRPGDDFGEGDVESVEHILYKYQAKSFCYGSLCIDAKFH